MAVPNQFKTAIREDRQMEGVAKAKAEGRYKGRTPTVNVEAVRRLMAENVQPTDFTATPKRGGKPFIRHDT